eukprot:CAMPEP_0201491220 /NCGR_PEP_ID=MMETSP0151_2-20130828/29003_1 /ASSEMBLY_ACC=CAM_ASM_000257 /TAXON_ID=200890 /ORGANISM="Paramoeba atlantica, Strain 621/1 / CCAP 1560/9" /LENGTH=209 /DNA_ID=CAMNT_0047877477 /DNA_START=18 /DNA_END=647 /DNA_ORIENTATION=+
MSDGHHHHHKCEEEHISISEQEARDQSSLFQYIDTEKVFCLNEEDEGSIRKVFKPHDQRLDKTQFTKSDCDEQLIIYIPFTGNVKLTSFCFSGLSESSSPAVVKAWRNRSDINFSNVESLKPVQEWALHPDLRAEIDYPVSVSHWQSCSSILFFISKNFGEDETELAYIGLKGAHQELKRDIVMTTYEAKPQPKDHPVGDETKGIHGVF